MTIKIILGATLALIIALVALNIPSPDEIAIDSAETAVQEVGNQIEEPSYRTITQNARFALGLTKILILLVALVAIVSAAMALVYAIVRAFGPA